MENFGIIYIYSLYLLYSLIICDAQNICEAPNECVHIKNCKPLLDIYNKGFYRTNKEYKFLRQSICDFGDGSRIIVCCPLSKISSYRKNEDAQISKPITKVQPKQPRQPEDKNTSQKNDRYKYTEKCGVEFVTQTKIVGGVETSIGEYPWLVLLEYRNNQIKCGGSLITSKLVLTAGHCILNSGGKPKKVRLAEYDLRTYPRDSEEVDGGGLDYITNIIIPVNRTIPYQKYRLHGAYDDIGIVVMARDATFTEFIQPICLPSLDYKKEFSNSTNFSFAGWGTDEHSEILNVKSAITVPYVPNNICQDSHDNNISDKQICAGGESGKDTCNGDSGGPLMYIKNRKYHVVGVLSYGSTRCGTTEPAVYTNVQKYLSWINSIIRSYSTPKLS